MVWFLPSLITAGASLIGGILDRNSAKDQQNAQFSYNSQNRQQDRHWYLKDRMNERDYAAKITRQDRVYAEGQKADERKYAREVLLDQRQYDAARFDATRDEQRKYDENKLSKDRQYMERRLGEQRDYDTKLYQRDIARYDADRDKMQMRSNNLAEQTAASRGINFQKLRDDAIAAGYNPMTALSMAHAYSTQVDYSLQGGPYSPGASYQTSNQGYSPLSGPSGGGVVSGGGGVAAPAGAVMGSHVPAGGGFSAGGGGYQSQFEPALSAGTFIKEAVDRGLDAWSNQPVTSDPLADALRNAFQQDQMAQEVRDSQIPGDFGYALTKQEAFQPELKVGVPALKSAEAAPGKAKMPSGMVQKGGRNYVPVTLPDGSQSNLEASVARRYDIQPFDALSAGDWEEIRGGVVGEAENTLNADRNYDLMTGDNFWPVPPSASDYLKSGVTGQRMLQSWPSN